MRLKCIGCDALARLIYLNAAYSVNIIDVSIFRLGLHTTPKELNKILQKEIDSVDSKRYDAIVLAYGLCGRSTEGLTARDIPLIIPRAHDCITIFLGGRDKYMQQQESCPGTYWYALDYVQRLDSTGGYVALGAGWTNTGTDIQSVYAEYVEKYGQDNADYLMEVMGAWQQHYQRAVYIDMGIGDGSQVEQMAKDEAVRRGWNFERIAGDMILIKRLFEGDWDETDFLRVNPGESIQMSMGEDIIRAIPAKR